MASFLDNIQALGSTNPYVQQLPVEQMAQAEQYMQQRHDEGVAKVQALVDSTTNLPIQKQGVKDYLNQKLTSLRSQITSSINGSLDDARVQSQIGSMVGAIAQDPIIQKGVQSTLAIQNGMAQAQKEREKGTANPYNVGLFQRQVSEYLANPDINSSFSGGYQQSFDYNKLWMENFKQVNPNVSVTDSQVITTGANGQPVISDKVLQELKTKGITPQQIQAVTNLTFSDPRAANQLNVEAEYVYGPEDPQNMLNALATKYETLAKDTNRQIDRIKLNAAANNNSNSIESAQLIKQLKDVASNSLEEYKRMQDLFQRNPSEAKRRLYQNEISNRYISAYAYQETSREVKANPMWEAELKEANYQLRLKDYNRKLQEHQDQLAAQRLKASSEEAGPEMVNVPSTISETEGQKGEVTFTQMAEQDFDNLSDAQNRLLGSLASVSNKKPPMVKDPTTGVWKYNVGPNGYDKVADAQQAQIELWHSVYTNHYSATAAPIVRKGMAEIEPLERNVRNNEVTQERINKRVDEALSFVKNSDQLRGLLKDNTPKTIDLGTARGAVMGSSALRGTATYTNDDLFNIAVFNTTDDKNVRQDALNSLRNRGINTAAIEQISRQDPTYRRVEGIVKNDPSVTQVIKTKSQLYKDAQLANQTFEHTFVTPTPQARRAVLSQVGALLGPLQDITGSKGNVSKFAEMLNAKNENLDISWKSNPDESITLIARDRVNGDTRKVDVPSTIAQRAPFYQGISTFQQRYGKSLALTGNTTTDVANYDQPASAATDGGRGTAYTINTGDYTVKYQLQGDGSGSQYFVKGWIFDQNGNILVDDKPFEIVGVPTWKNQQEIVSFVDQVLTNNQYINSIISNASNANR